MNTILWWNKWIVEWKEIFAWLPVETLIKENQKEYYNVLGASDSAANSTKFIEFMLSLIIAWRHLVWVLESLRLIIHIETEGFEPEIPKIVFLSVFQRSKLAILVNVINNKFIQIYLRHIHYKLFCIRFQVFLHWEYSLIFLF